MYSDRQRQRERLSHFERQVVHLWNLRFVPSREIGYRIRLLHDVDFERTLCCL